MILSVQETFRDGKIKVSRRRCLLPRSLDSASAEILQDYCQEQDDGDEHLRWIDLDAHPDEPEDAWSSTFDEPRAYDALVAFRRACSALLQERRTPPLVEESAAMLAALRGLGYAGEEARIGTLPSDDLVLPPPGERMLGKSADR